jgi:ABC-2 type transport system permease protein
VPSPDRGRRADPARVAVVARREFLSTVTRKGYILTLIFLPVLMAMIAVLPAIGLALSGGEEEMLGMKKPYERTVVGLVDGPGFLKTALIDNHNADQEAAKREKRRKPSAELESLPKIPDGAPVPDFVKERLADAERDYGGLDWDRLIDLRVYEDRAAALGAVRSGEASAVYVLAPSYFDDSRIAVLLPSVSPLNPGIFPGQRAIARLIRLSIIDGKVTEPSHRLRIAQVMDAKEEIVGLEGEEPPTAVGATPALDEVMQTLLPLLFASFFSMLIFVASGYLLDGIGEEKENRVLEVLLASLTPEELLLGKMIGLGAAGLLQTAFFAMLGLGPMLIAGLIDLPLTRVAAMLGCGIFGYAEYASLMAASGAIAGNRQEGRQISAVFTLMAMLPMFILPVFITGADKAIPTIMSLAPPTAPIAMVLRLGMGDVQPWQLAVSFAGMALMAWLSWRIGSRIFRVGILMTGARPPLRTVIGWIRQG